YFLVIDAEFQLAEQSITSKQKERYEKLIEDYKNFIDRYPSSERLREAEKMYTQSLEQLNRLKKINI
ncbi:MAG: outer membrane protein assembly factor BamD, partial [Cytophagia bacterium]|nr:outer membrane protein assembly factor BamD [Cytophagia bacterium]